MTNQHPHGEQGDAYRRIRALILSGSLEMGERLVETRLAELIGLSRTPVREALRRLTSDGLVIFRPNRGHQVVSFSAQDVAEIYSCRALLEGEAVRLVAENRLRPSALERMEALIAEAGELFAEGVPCATRRQKFLPLNNAFHDQLYSECGNGTLHRMIRKNLTIPAGIRNYFQFSDARLSASHAAHEKILRAVIAGDATRASALMREHIWTAKDSMIDPEKMAAGGEAPPTRHPDDLTVGPPVLSKA